MPSDFASPASYPPPPKMGWGSIKRHFIGPLSDGILWGSILLTLLASMWFLGQNEENGWDLSTWLARLSRKSSPQIIRLPFIDANEITQGSQVRMMGTEIGLVQKISLKPKYAPDHVELVLKTHSGGVKIPPHSTITVLFTGLAGSKSVEVIPPDSQAQITQTTPLELRQSRATYHGKSYVVEDPIRMRDSLNYQIAIAEALRGGAQNTAKLFGRSEDLVLWQQNISLVQSMTGSGPKALDQVIDLETADQNSIHAGLKKATDIVVRTQSTAVALQKRLHAEAKRPKLAHHFQKFRLSMQALNRQLKPLPGQLHSVLKPSLPQPSVSPAGLPAPVPDSEKT